MTQRKRHRNQGESGRQGIRDPELQALYREAGDAEPDSGLDRIIRARADEAGRDRRTSNRLPWLSGLVTASVAIVAISVVLQQSPPGEPKREAIGPLELGEPEAFMAPSMGARTEQKAPSNTEADEKRTDSPLMRSASPSRNPAAPAPEPVEQAAPESLRDQQRHHLDVVASEEARIVAERAREVSGRMTEGLADRVADNPDRMLEEIRKLLEQDKTAEAREWLKRLREDHPDHAVPEDIEQALAPPLP